MSSVAPNSSNVNLLLLSIKSTLYALCQQVSAIKHQGMHFVWLQPVKSSNQKQKNSCSVYIILHSSCCGSNFLLWKNSYCNFWENYLFANYVCPKKWQRTDKTFYVGFTVLVDLLVILNSVLKTESKYCNQSFVILSNFCVIKNKICANIKLWGIHCTFDQSSTPMGSLQMTCVSKLGCANFFCFLLFYFNSNITVYCILQHPSSKL